MVSLADECSCFLQVPGVVHSTTGGDGFINGWVFLPPTSACCRIYATIDAGLSAVLPGNHQECLRFVWIYKFSYNVKEHGSAWSR